MDKTWGADTPKATREPAKLATLDSSDALRIASTDERFAKALMAKPEEFAAIFRLTPREIEAIRRIPELADLSTAFSYDA